VKLHDSAVEQIIRHPPGKPLLIFDGECNFCRRWVERWREMTGERVDYAAFQEIGERYSEIPRAAFAQAVHLIEPSGVTCSGADAVFRTLDHSPRRVFWIASAQRVPGFLALARTAYRVVARHRSFFSFLTRLAWGRSVKRSRYVFARWLFLRFMGVIYLTAFVSLAVQVLGLIGKRGILPAGAYLDEVRAQLGPERFWLIPSVFWFDARDTAIIAASIAGALLSACLIAGWLPTTALFFLWLLYLSFASVCQVFLGYQWDALLLETGLLAIFLSAAGSNGQTGKVARWLMLWLLFRLLFESGIVKLASHDPTWRNLTALTYHYQTQPLSIWTSWYAHRSPLLLHKFTALCMFGIELGAPFLIFAPRNLKRIGAGSMIALQCGIAATGNYAFFNLLTIALALLLFDDDFWPSRWRSAEKSPGLVFSWAVYPLAAISFVTTTMPLISMLRSETRWPRPLLTMYQRLGSLRSFNSYGLFAVMTTTRPEIVLEGSNDGENWLAYEFKFKPGELAKRPGIVAPHQPRLDWQMWFAALGTVRENPWFLQFMQRILEGSPEVLNLLASNPFPLAPPRYLRAALYDYQFSKPGDPPQTWWRREYRGLYCPSLSLRD
jgi:predicted DCC family thiol-disulfide oxidoreductase YuxK